MKLFDGLKYLLLSLAIYLTISFFEFYVLSPIVDFISYTSKFHLYVCLFCLVIVNPVISWLVINRINFNPSQNEIDKSISE